MTNYFLDTSALAKLYRRETGSEYMDRILHESGSRWLISRLSIVEMESVLAIKGRTGEMDQQDVEIAILRADLSQRRLLVGPPIRAHHYQTGRTLLVRYGAAQEDPDFATHHIQFSRTLAASLE